MPFTRPTLTDLRQQAMNDITASDLPNADGLLRRAVLRVLAWVQAGMAHLHYGYLDWISRMAVPFTAAEEFLVAWAALVGIFRKDATGATGSITFTGTPGSAIPAGTLVVRSDGVQFVTTDDGVISGAETATVPVRALAAGLTGQTDVGTQFVLGAAVTGVNSSGIAAVAFSGGADQEADESLRTRMLQRYAAPPQGGAASDYLRWALEVPGVTRVWVVANGLGGGTVIVYIMLDAARAVYDGFPIGTDGVAYAEPRAAAATGDQLLVANHLFPLRPVTALVYVASPISYEVDVDIADLDQNTVAVQADIRAALIAVLREEGQVGGTLYPSTLVAAIQAVANVNRFTLVAPAAPVVLPAGNLPVLGALSIA